MSVKLSSDSYHTPWIHLEDYCRIILEALPNEAYEGVVNVCTPKAVSADELSAKIAALNSGLKLKLTIPTRLVKLILGEVSSLALADYSLENHTKLERLGFKFKFQEIDSCLKDISLMCGILEKNANQLQIYSVSIP